MLALASYHTDIKKWIMPVLLIFFFPPIVVLMWYVNVHLEGSLQKLLELFVENGCFATLLSIWTPLFFGSPTAWKILSIFTITELILMKCLPGRLFQTSSRLTESIPIKSKSVEPRLTHKANGLSAFTITLVLFYLGSGPLGLFSPTIIYDHFGPLLGALNLFSLLFCLLLYLKGLYRPSSTDSKITNSAVSDFFWGTELYPKILGWDVKIFTYCRFSMMGWGLILLSFAAKQIETYGWTNALVIAVTLQLLYIAKFFWGETTYSRVMDIMYDRTGFCLCWGCMVWLPCIYTSPTLYLIHHPHQLSILSAICIFIIGATAIMINYLADRQRHHVRIKNGECTVWRKKPALIFANYTTEWGENSQNLLLASGWWGISRHFHYLPEIIGALCWSLPALFSHFLPYFYVCFLILLLIDRAYRHEKRCALKYGKDWEKYCEQVPFRLIPFVY